MNGSMALSTHTHTHTHVFCCCCWKQKQRAQHQDRQKYLCSPIMFIPNVLLLLFIVVGLTLIAVLNHLT
jgi:Na+/H+ antiporter NhaC